MTDTVTAGPATTSAPGKSCGACTLCCELFEITDLDKPENVLCRHATREGGGCSIYEDRPQVCRAFLCHWLVHAAFDDGWKPDACHFFVTQPDRETLLVAVDPAYPDAWRQAPFYQQIKLWSEVALNDKGRVMVHVGDQVWAVFPEEDLLGGAKTPSGRISMGYFRDGDLRRPYVAMTDAQGETRTVNGRLYRGMPEDYLPGGKHYGAGGSGG